MQNYFNPSYQFNPMLNPQQRLAQMEAQFNQQQNSFAAIPVSNIQEANAYRVDINGTPTLFYNAGKNEVYLKRTNLNTGMADFHIFSKVEEPTSPVVPQVDANSYEKNFKALNDKIDGIYQMLSGTNKKEILNQVQNDSIEIEEKPTKGGKNAK